MKDGFVTLIGLLIAALIIAMIVWGVEGKNKDSKGQIDTYNDAILDAENVKSILESKNINNEK